MKYLMLFFLFPFYLSAENLEMTIHLNEADNNIVSIVKFKEERKSTSLENAQAIIVNFESLYNKIEKRNRFKKEEYRSQVEVLSKQFIKPFEQEIEAASEIQIILDTNLLKLPVEYLELKGSPISVQKIITFKLDHKKQAAIELNLTTGTIVADKSCDPQFACRAAHNYFPEAAYYSSKEINAQDLKEEQQDLLLISAHGFSDGKTQGVLGWNHNRLSVQKIKKINPKICYFDSCQQGVNFNYLKALYNNNTLNYYLGPIVSNDSGDSSTKNIASFFLYITNQKSPAQSLLETKQDLYKSYKKKRRIVRESKSLCFRLYEL